MPRTARAAQAGSCYHVPNRGNGRHTVFPKAGECAAFGKLLRQAFPIQEEDHLVSVLRDIERNPVGAGLVDQAEQ